MENLTGRQFGPYQIVAPVGEGGMAAVYKAYQSSMERYVALKVLPRQMAQSEEFIARFKREARLLAQLQHPHILPVFDYGQADDFTYIVMPYVQSGTLADLLKARRVNYSEIRRIVTQIADALGYAHARGMIHRDIKPSNVLVDERGNCLLTDFGLARMAVATSMLTSSGAIMGTPAYMSPEQGTGGVVDGRSDIYSLGIILYEMVTGRVPYSAETPIAIVFKHIQDALPPARNFAPDLPEALELVLLKSLAKRPEDRYQTTDEFIHAIQEAIPFTSAVTPAPTSPPSPALQVNSAPPSPNANLPTMLEPVSKPPSRPPSTPPVAAPASYTPPSQPSYKSVAQSQIQPARKGLPVWALAGAGVIGLGLVAILAIALAINFIRNNLAAPVPTDLPTATPPAAATTAPEVVAPTDVAPVAALEILPGEYFTDNFENQLAEGWWWEAEDPSRWSLSNEPGALQIIASGTSFSIDGIPTNLLVREAPNGDFEISTLLRFSPQANYQFAGLVVFQDKGNALQFGRGYCNSPGICIGDGLYFDSWQNTANSESNLSAKIWGEQVYLRLRKAGNVYSAFYSSDGYTWTLLGEYERELSNIRVGVTAAQSPTNIPATFDFFSLSEPPRAVVRQEIECFSAPDMGSNIRGVFQVGETVSLQGRSADSEWLVSHAVSSPEDLCWIHFSVNNRAEIAESLPVIDPNQKAESLPEPPPLVIPPGEKFVRINNITINAQNQYVLEYETFEYTEILPGTHVHFFFNTVPFDQAGSPGRGPWKIYGGPRPFTGYRTIDRPQNASQLCALVANPNHSVIPNSGHCFPLPDVPTATARVETACRSTPSESGTTLAVFRAGATVLLKGVSSDQGWLSIQNPDKLDASACWVPFNSSVLGGDLGNVPTINP
jgi:serine/threonine protein kinase